MRAKGESTCGFSGAERRRRCSGSPASVRSRYGVLRVGVNWGACGRVKSKAASAPALVGPRQGSLAAALAVELITSALEADQLASGDL